MAVAIDGGSATFGTFSGAGTHTLPVTCSAGVKQLAVGHSYKDSALTSVTGITYNGIALTALGSGYVGGTGDVCRMWVLKNPDTGSAFNLVVTFSGDPVGGSVLGAWPLLDAGDPVNVTPDSQSTTSLTLTVINSAGGLVVVVGAGGNTFTSTSGTQDWNTFGVASHFGLGAHGSNTPQIVTWTQGTPDLWEAMGASFPSLTPPPLSNMNVNRAYRPRPYGLGSIR